MNIPQCNIRTHIPGYQSNLLYTQAHIEYSDMHHCPNLNFQYCMHYHSHHLASLLNIQRLNMLNRRCPSYTYRSFKLSINFRHLILFPYIYSRTTRNLLNPILRHFYCILYHICYSRDLWCRILYPISHPNSRISFHQFWELLDPQRPSWLHRRVKP